MVLWWERGWAWWARVGVSMVVVGGMGNAGMQGGAWMGEMGTVEVGRWCAVQSCVAVVRCCECDAVVPVASLGGVVAGVV